MNPKEELILKILSSVDVIQGKTKFIKILHFTCKLFEEHQIEPPFKFRPDNFGVYSPELEPTLENLESNRYVKITRTIFSKRNDLSLLNRSHAFQNEDVLKLSPKIDLLVQTLNPYSSDEVVAISYYLFPEMAVNSLIKPKINKKINELFSISDPDFEDSMMENPLTSPVFSESRTLSPQFNDLDVRMRMMKSIGLEELLPIIPNSIDNSSGIIANETFILKKYDFEKLLGDARRR